MISFSQAFEGLLAALDRIEIPFLIGGSVASGSYGIPRQTNDIDIVIDLPVDRVEDFCEALGPDWYADREMIRRALNAGRSVNLIHFPSASKFDLFPVGGDTFGRSQLARRRFTTSSIPGLEKIEFPVASAEDTILAKLVWFRRGGETSDRQWHDILGVLRVQAGRLDLEYLSQWAKELQISDLLSKAQIECF